MHRLNGWQMRSGTHSTPVRVTKSESPNRSSDGVFPASFPCTARCEGGPIAAKSCSFPYFPDMSSFGWGCKESLTFCRFRAWFILFLSMEGRRKFPSKKLIGGERGCRAQRESNLILICRKDAEYGFVEEPCRDWKGLLHGEKDIAGLCFRSI